MRRSLLAVIAVLYLLSIPWYREPGTAPALWLGLPDWVAVALGCYVAVAVCNALAWAGTSIEDPDPEEDGQLEAGSSAAGADAEAGRARR